MYGAVPIFKNQDTLSRVLVGLAEGNGTKGGQHTEEDRDGLLEADGAGNGRAAEDDRGEEAQFHAVRLAVLDAIATEAVCVFEARVSKKHSALCRACRRGCREGNLHRRPTEQPATMEGTERVLA